MDEQEKAGQAASDSSGASEANVNVADTSAVNGKDEAPAGFEQTCLSLMQQTIANQSDLARALADLSGQNSFLRQQLSQLYGVVGQLSQTVVTQSEQSLKARVALQQELQKFQTGGPQRAMAGLYNKLFRELIEHVNEMDALLAGLDQAEQEHTIEGEWLKAIRITRNRFEQLLQNWGCRPMPIRVGEEEFNPEIHDAVHAEENEIPASVPDNIIVKVRRRGWMLHDHILQHPQVVVS